MTTILGLLVLGTALVFLETVLVGGVWAVAGVACYGGAVWAANAEFGAGAALAAVALSSLGCVAAFLVWLYVIPKTAAGRKLYLNSKQDGRAPSPDFARLVGKKARALTPLAPTGKVEIDGLPYDARCETAVATAGEELVVSRATPFELIVVKI